MFTRYYFLANSVTANIRSDLAAIICGVTSAADLSASADKVNTVFLANTHVSTWTLHDAAASSTSFVVRSLAADGTTYKYAQVLVTAARVVSVVLWETWNATTHVGTNQGSGASMLSVLQVGTLPATASHVHVSVSPAGLVLGHLSSFAMVSEFTPDGMSTGPGYPRHVGLASNGSSSFFTGSTQYSAVCRVKNPTAAGDIVGAAMPIILPFGLPTRQALGTQGLSGPYLTAFPLSMCSTGPGAISFFYLGELLGVTHLHVTFTRSSFDEVVVAGVLSLMLVCDDDRTLVIPKV